MADAHTPLPYDVFISYRTQEPDKSWVRKILVPRLETDGLRVLIDYRDFRLGATLVTEMERAVVSSRYTLMVMSPSYLNSEFTNFENVLADQLGLELARRKLLGIMRVQCEPTLRFRARLWLDMRDEAEFEDNAVRLINELKQSTD